MHYPFGFLVWRNNLDMFTSIWSELGSLWIGDVLALCENIALVKIAMILEILTLKCNSHDSIVSRSYSRQANMLNRCFLVYSLMTGNLPKYFIFLYCVLAWHFQECFQLALILVKARDFPVIWWYLIHPSWLAFYFFWFLSLFFYGLLFREQKFQFFLNLHV